jgi:Fur family ferric uptake transcriptional regulator
MATKALEKILKSHELRITNCRVDVLLAFKKTSGALSLGVLENQFPQYDRVTLYRTLNSFLDSGILHKIPNDQGTATYGLCHETCSPKDHNHDHIHFKCNECGKLECLDEMTVPEVRLPEGYSLGQINLIVDGVCAQCA